MAELLSDEQINEALTKLPDWERDGTALKRTAKLATFSTAIQVVNRVAEIANGMDHHPDIDIRFRTLHFSLSTHAMGGITGNDTTMAGQIDEVVADT